MPFGDGTGPAGLGPMTGRGAGYCAGYSTPGQMNPLPGRGFWGWGRGFGRGGGRGWRHWFHATGLPGWMRAPYGAPVAPTVSSGQEVEALKGQAQFLADALEGIRKRLSELEESEKKP